MEILAIVELYKDGGKIEKAEITINEDDIKYIAERKAELANECLSSQMISRQIII
jgi:hypothetical protein